MKCLQAQWPAIFLLSLACCPLSASQKPQFKLGLERVTKQEIESFVGKKNPKIGHITNQTGIDKQKRRNVYILR